MATLKGDSDIIDSSNKAKENTDMLAEKEALELAVLQAANKDKWGEVTVENLSNELDKQIKGQYDIAEDTGIVVRYKESERRYFIDTNKDVTLEEGTPGNPDSDGYFTEESTINGRKESATNPKIPQGFKPLDQGKAKWGDGLTAPTEEAINEGLVIQDKSYNEFVWVPVPKFEEFKREAGYYNGGLTQPCTFTSTVATSKKYYEQLGDGTSEKTEVEKMYKSVKENCGFYIGRFETGFEGNKAKTTYTTYQNYTQLEINSETEKLVVKPNVQVYNFVPWGAGVDDISAVNKGTTDNPTYVIGAVELARNFGSVNNYTGIVSTLCYGVQWDAVMRWMKEVPNENVSEKKYIENSLGMGWYVDNYSAGNINHKTGIKVDEKASNKVNNIYDMAGNVYEWTMESYSTDRKVSRGGQFNDVNNVNPASFRDYGIPINASSVDGFRIALYVE